MQVDSTFYGNFASKLNMEQYREDAAWKVQVLLSVMPNGRKYDSVLEVGCGSALVLKGIADAVGAEHRTGIDISQEMLSLAKKQQGVATLLMDADKAPLPFAHKHFDLVILSDILEHVEKPELLLKEASKVGKAVLVKIPAEKGQMHTSIKEGHAGGHIHNWTAPEVLKMLDGYYLRFGMVDPPTRIQFRNWRWRWTVNPLYWVMTGLCWGTWLYWRKVYRELWGTTVVAYMEVR